MIILDTSEIQARVPDPTVREVARLTWESMSIPQNAIPITVDGHEYLVEIDEFGAQDVVGAGRIIDIADEERPRVISNLRLDVHQPERFDAQAGDPGAQNPLQGYAGHYCNVPRRDDPGIVACSMILSGLRVFDIRDPRNPREIAYYNAPIGPRLTPGFEASNWAMSSPSFVPERGEIWYSDGFQGFFAVRLTNGVWPFARCRRPGDDDQRRLQGDRRNRRQGRDRRSPAAGQDQSQGRRDLVCANGAGDRVKGGAGNDRVLGQGGRDRLLGGTGKDRLKGGKGRDKLVGGRGSDRLAGGPGRDTLSCGPGARDLALAGRKDRVRRSCERVR